MSKALEIADYDKAKYDYRQYWIGRDYENICDEMAIRKLSKGESGNWYIDIGGGYGRLVNDYPKSFKNYILMDYSVESLRVAKSNNKDRKNLYYVAADIYKLPFKDEVIDGGQIVRVLHHIQRPDLAIPEMLRIIKNSFIMEFANKVHFLAKMKSLAKLNPKFMFDQSIYEQGSKSTSQGKTDNSKIFLNFHPKYIKKIIQKDSFYIKDVLSVSNFRNQSLKKVIPQSGLVMMEDKLQGPLSLLNFGPSIYLKLKRKGIKVENNLNDFKDLLVCPECKGTLIITDEKCECKKCVKEYKIEDGIYNFRGNS